MMKVAILQERLDFRESVTRRVTVTRPAYVEPLYAHHYEVVRESVRDHVMARFWAAGS